MVSSQVKVVLAEFRQYLRSHKPTESIIDTRTHNLLIRELKKRVRRKQTSQITEIKDLIHKSHKLQDIESINPILRRCYVQGLYRDHEELRYFIRAKIDRWPSVGIREIVENNGKSLDRLVKNPKNFSKIKIPEKSARDLPSVAEIMAFDEKSMLEVEPLPIQGVIDKDKDKLDSMFQKVLKLYHFIQTTGFLHSRNLESLVAIIPTTVLGEPIAECRVKNIIKRKLSYIRKALVTIPPLECEDSEYLTRILDQFHDSGNPKAGKLGIRVRREYKKFLRRTYTIDQDFNIILNKYAFIRPGEPDRNDYFETIEK